TVIDNKTKEDITYRTLIQLLHVLETKHAHNGMVKDLNRVIRGKEGTFSGFIRELEGVEYVPPVKEVPAEVVASESQEAENTNTISFN
ncbi:MAG: hypothetical protein OEY33_07240, partial [Bdellovibrionales bacterium]|nr:hypothetical protein [Bdellovibrionales bacterium]